MLLMRGPLPEEQPTEPKEEEKIGFLRIYSPIPAIENSNSINKDSTAAQ
jgi:hypothetical protein